MKAATPAVRAPISDRSTITMSGFPVLFGGLAALGLAGWMIWHSFGTAPNGLLAISASWIGLGFLVGVAALFVMSGIYTVQPNQSAVIVLFGRYVGTDSEDGFRWTNPLAQTQIVSRRVNSFETSVLKVNDGNGNPIEIAAAIVWRVQDAARAKLQVQDYAQYVKIQSEGCLRVLANSHPYDRHDAPKDEDGQPVTDAPVPADEIKRVPSLLGGGNEVTDALLEELRERLGVAGIEVDEARITHLAYAPEIAPAMLRRQQAQAIVAARKIMVEGAVGMVKDAFDSLTKKGIPVEDDRRAAMISNMMVVLVSDREATPVVNAGSIYG